MSPRKVQSKKKFIEPQKKVAEEKLDVNDIQSDADSDEIESQIENQNVSGQDKFLVCGKICMDKSQLNDCENNQINMRKSQNTSVNVSGINGAKEQTFYTKTNIRSSQKTGTISRPSSKLRLDTTIPNQDQEAQVSKISMQIPPQKLIVRSSSTSNLDNSAIARNTNTYGLYDTKNVQSKVCFGSDEKKNVNNRTF